MSEYHQLGPQHELAPLVGRSRPIDLFSLSASQRASLPAKER